MASKNPFAPTFGTHPPALAGRDDILADLDEAFDTGPTHPDFTVLFIGIRGAGKTVMLNAAEDMVRARGWLTISELGSPNGLIGRLTRHVCELLDEPGGGTRRLSGLQAAGVGVSFEHRDRATVPPDLRSALAALGDLTAADGTGVLITVDELHSADLGEIREFGGILQQITRRQARPVAFAAAALPYLEDELLSGPHATFLQRCSRHDIGPLAATAAKEALAIPLAASGATIGSADLDGAAEATGGHAFMVQLVGFYIWKAASDPAAGISSAEVSSGIEQAEQRMSRLVIAPTWNDLSDVDRSFLSAMTLDADQSTIRDIATRMGVSENYAHVYRRRLLRSGMIIAVTPGTIAFAHVAARHWTVQHTHPSQ